jgi:histone-lysine N-methyltransferase SETMAR
LKEISSNIPSEGINIDDWNESYEGCKCNYNDCYSNKNSCSCLNYHKIQPYKISNKSNIKIINLDLLEHDDLLLGGGYSDDDLCTQLAQINECSLECNCDEDTCLNRLVQNGVKFKLEIFDCLPIDKGKGVRAKENIQAGSFICEYMGEVIGKIEAEKRFKERSSLNEKNFILALREYYSSNENIKETFIDARNYGNIGRFINHSCEPNLLVIPVRIDNIIPCAALFAIKDIQIDEELSYNYNRKCDESILSKNICYCASSKCKGFLPGNKF